MLWTYECTFFHHWERARSKAKTEEEEEGGEPSEADAEVSDLFSGRGL